MRTPRFPLTWTRRPTVATGGDARRPAPIERLPALVRQAENRIWPHGMPLIDAPGTTLPAQLAAVLRLGLLLALAGTVGQGAVSFVNNAIFGDYEGVLSADSDAGVFAWLGIAAEIPTVVAAVLLASLVLERRGRFSVVAAAVAFLTLDDFVGIHERISSVGSSLDYCGHCARTFWPIVYLPLLALTFALLWSLVASTRPEYRRFARVGLALLVLATILEATSPVLFQFGWGHTSAPYEAEVVVEEGAEYAGWLLISTGLLALAAEGYVALGFRARAQADALAPAGPEIRSPS